MTRRHEANCLMIIWEPSRSFCFHPVSLPGSPLGLAQCWETGLGKCPSGDGGRNTQEAGLGRLRWVIYNRRGGSYVFFTSFEDPRVLLHPAPRAEGYEVRSPKLGAVLVPSLSPKAQHLRLYLQPTVPPPPPPPVPQPIHLPSIQNTLLSAWTHTLDIQMQNFLCLSL